MKFLIISTLIRGQPLLHCQVFCKLFQGYMRLHILEMSAYLDYKHPFFWDIPLFAFVNDAVLLQLWIT